MSAGTEPHTVHLRCRWEQIGPCVYCADHHVRLYQGSLPADRRPPACQPDQHDWDDEEGMGFYGICRTCKTVEWFE